MVLFRIENRNGDEAGEDLINLNSIA